MSRVGATGSTFYYFRDFFSEKWDEEIAARRVCVSRQFDGSMIDRRSGRKNNDPVALVAKSIHVQSAACHFRYIYAEISEGYISENARARALAGTIPRRILIAFLSTICSRRDTSPTASCITVSLNFPRRS